MIRNNLKNVKITDAIYPIKQAQIEDLLDSELKQLMRSSHYLSIICTDNYFLHYSLYPILIENNEDYILNKVLEFQKKYVKKEEYAKIKALTTLDDTLSLAYTYYFTKVLLKELKQELEKEMQNYAQNDMESVLNQIILRFFSSESMKQKVEMAQREALDNTKKLSEIKDFLSDLSAGKSGTDFRKVLDLSDRIINNTLLYKIITEGKKIQTELPTFVKITKVKDKHGQELSEYGITRDIFEARVADFSLPEELFLYKFASSSFTSLIKHNVAEGAYYILIDKSGSMSNETKIIYSRSLALALFKLSRRKKRKYFLQFFDTYVYPYRPLDNPEEILECLLKVENSGGTDIDNAIYVAMNNLIRNKLDQYTNTLIIITDGEDTVTTQKEWLERNNVSLISIMVGGDNETLKQLSTRYFKAEFGEEGIFKIIEAVK